MRLESWTPEERIAKLEAELEFERNRHEETKSQLLKKELENQRLLAEIEKLKLSASKKKKKTCRRHVKRLEEQLKKIPEVIPVDDVNLKNLEDSEDIQKTSEIQTDHGSLYGIEHLEKYLDKDSEDTQMTSEAQMMYMFPMDGLYQTLAYRPQMGNLVPNKVWPRQSSALVLKALQEAEALEKASKDQELENQEVLEETDSEDTEISETQKDPEFSENESEDTHQPSEISETQSKIASLETNYSHLLNLKIPFIF